MDQCVSQQCGNLNPQDQCETKKDIQHRTEVQNFQNEICSSLLLLYYTCE